MNNLLTLEKQRIKAEADSKKTGIFTKPNAKKKYENIEKQINELIGKYEGVEATDPGVQQRQETALIARDARKNMLMDKITQGVKESKTYKQMDIETKEVETELEARELFEQNINT